MMGFFAQLIQQLWADLAYLTSLSFVGAVVVLVLIVALHYQAFVKKSYWVYLATIILDAGLLMSGLGLPLAFCLIALVIAMVHELGVWDWVSKVFSGRVLLITGCILLVVAALLGGLTGAGFAGTIKMKVAGKILFAALTALSFLASAALVLVHGVRKRRAGSVA